MGHPWSPRAHLDLMRCGYQRQRSPYRRLSPVRTSLSSYSTAVPIPEDLLSLNSTYNDTCGLLDTKRLIQFSPPGLAFEKLLRKREGRKRRLAEDQSDVKKKSLPSSWEGSPLAVLGDLCNDKLLQGRGCNLYHERFRSRGSNERSLSGLASFSF